MRFLFTLLATFCLLFQQTAVAATACLMDASPSVSGAMAEHCAGMDMATHAPALCRAHCAPDPGLKPVSQSPAPDFIQLPTPHFDLLATFPLPEPDVPAIRPVHRSDPPPRLRYCRLLI